MFMQDLRQHRSKLISHRPKRQQLYYIYHMILNQRRLSYNTILAVWYYFRCFTCRKRTRAKKTKSSRKDFYLDKGIEKLERDLDIVNLLDIVKGYHVMKQVLFSQDDRFLLQLQRRDMIYSSETAEEEMEQKMLAEESGLKRTKSKVYKSIID